MNKKERLHILLSVLQTHFNSAFISENYGTFTKEQLKEEIKDYNKEISVFNHYHKQFIKLTGKSFINTFSKIKLSDFEDKVEKYNRG